MSFKKGRIPWNKGLKTGIQTKGTTGMKFKYNKDRAKKISLALIGVKKTEEHKRKLSEYAKKRKWPTEHKKRISNTLKEKYKKNPELKKKLATYGEKNGSWQGGISYEPYSIDWTDDLKRAVRKRDRYTCFICKKEPAICVHHIDYNKKNCNPDNLITLCTSCHTKTNFNRRYWIEYFKNLWKI